MDTVNICMSRKREKLKSWWAAKVYSDVGKGEEAWKDKGNSPRSGSAFLQCGGCVGSIGESTLGGHDQWEGHTGFTGTLAVGVGHWNWVDTATWAEDKSWLLTKQQAVFSHKSWDKTDFGKKGNNWIPLVRWLYKVSAACLPIIPW